MQEVAPVLDGDCGFWAPGPGKRPVSWGTEQQFVYSPSQLSLWH